MNGELRAAITRARRRIDRVHPEADRLSPLELIVQETVLHVAGRIEIDHVTEQDQTIAAARLTRNRRRGQQRDQDERRASAKLFHRGEGNRVPPRLSSALGANMAQFMRATRAPRLCRRSTSRPYPRSTVSSGERRL